MCQWAADGAKQPPSAYGVDRPDGLVPYAPAMATRTRNPERMREALLDAGTRLAAEVGLADTSVNRVVAEAGVAKGSFFWHFPRREDFVVALHRRFHDRLLDDIAAETRRLEPGRERLRVAVRTYLEACLRERAVKAFLLEARAAPRIADEVRRRNRQMAQLAADELREMGWSNPEAAAPLVVAMVAEIALLELDAGRRQPKIRAALERFLTDG